MAIELAAAAAAKAIIAAGAKTALVELRTQISRSGAAYANIAANMGAESGKICAGLKASSKHWQATALP